MNGRDEGTANDDALEKRIASLTPAQRRLFDRLAAGAGGAEPGIGRRPQDGTEVPMSFEQERLWFMNELIVHNQIFHVPVALRLRGELRTDALERALACLVERHEALRTVFREGRTAPCQVVLDKVRVPLAVESCTSAPDPLAEARTRASKSVGAPFDLRTGPLLRCTLYEIGDRNHLLVLVQHHIISDYWSLGILLDDLSTLYAAELGRGAEPETPELHYPDFAHWQRRTRDGAALDRQRDYWRERLSDAPEVLELPTDRPRPAIRSSQGAFHHIEFPAGPVERLRSIAKEESTTLLGAFLALYAGFLGRLARQDTVVIGVPVAARSRPETQRMVGYFLNWLAIRVDLDGRPSLRELVRRTGRALTEAMANQDLPFDVLVRDLQYTRRPGTTPVFQTSFSLRDGAPEPPRLPGVEAEFANLEGGATHFDLMAELWCEDDRVVGYLPFDDELFDASTVASFAAWMLRLAEEATADPDQPVAALPLLSDAEQVVMGNTGPAESGEVCTTLHERFREQAAGRPDAVAVSDEEVRLTYGETDERADRIAHALRRHGAGPGSVVGVVIDRTVDRVAAVLGVLKCGAAYLPVEPDAPAQRTAVQFADCSVRVALVGSGLEDRLPEGSFTALTLDWDSPELADSPSPPVNAKVPPSAPAYVIYTSGSTGAPKGVLVSHANVLRLFSASDGLFELGREDVWTLFHSYSFDFSVWELWGALAHGGRLVVVPKWVTRAPDAFAELVEREGVTVLSQTPSAFAQFSRAVLADPPPLSLRYVVFGGEALEHAALEPWIRAFGDERPRLINMYGITETTVHVTFRGVTAADTVLAESLIGDPLPDLSLYLLDEELRPVPDGIPGEIYVGGAGVALGYQNAPALTAERMVPDPHTRAPGARMYRTGDIAIRRGADRRLAYLGRTDEQHKIRGHRVEIGEVQAALNRLEDVADGAVLVAEDRSGHKALAAYAVVTEGGETSPTRIRRSLLRSLPDWMVPSSVVLLDALPLTPNGKLDRRALAAQRPDRERQRTGPSRPPEGKTAAALAEIWSELLGREGIGPEDDFFELGGHSLMVVRLVSQIRLRLGVEVPVEVLFQHPELEALAEALDELGAGGTAAPQDGNPLPPAPAPGDAYADDIAAVEAEITERLAHVRRPGPEAPPPGDEQTVLLTGASGFLGAFTLAELLSRGNTVVCLLRGGASRSGELLGRLRELGLWCEEHEARLEIVDGDIGQRHLGLTPAVHASLCERVGRVVHTAAWVNHIYPYHELVRVNAYSVPALLEFASTARLKSVTAVSTSAVFESPAYAVDEEISHGPLSALPSERNGYARSKAVGEFYLARAAEFGVPAVVVRCPSIYGDRDRFQVNESDYIWSWTKAMLATGRYPDSFDTPDNDLFQALPADAVSAVLADTGHPQDDPGCRILNAIPNVVCRTRDLLAGLREAGHDLEPMADREWYRRVGGLDAREIWVAGIAAQIAELPDPSSVRQQLRRFRTDEEPDLSRLANEQAIASVADIAGYVRTLAGSGDAP